MKSPIILRIFKNNQLVEVKQFGVDSIVFGNNAPDVLVNLDDQSVSAIHCIVELRDSGYYLSDLGSMSGTMKNGSPITDEAISSGDQIEIGPYRIQFFVGAPKPVAAPVSVKKEEPVAQPVVPPAPVSVNKPPTSTSTAVKTSIPSQPATSAPRPPKLPGAAVASSTYAKSKKHGGTFAPESEVKDLSTYLKPTKGPVVEVIVAWHERVLSTYHFGGDHPDVLIGSSEKAHVIVPSQFISGAVPFIELKGGCRVIANHEMTVEMVNDKSVRFSLEELSKSGKATRAGNSNSVRLDQGELLQLTSFGGALQIYIRFVPNTIRPVLAHPLDMGSSELTGLIVSLVLVMLAALYMSVYTPPVAEEKEEEKVMLAKFIYASTTTTMPVREVVKEEPPPPPAPAPPTTTMPPKKIQVTETKKEPTDKGSSNAKGGSSGGQASDTRPNPNKNLPKKFGSTVPKGGAVKMSDSSNANAQSKDVTKVGLLSAFGGGGNRQKLDQAYSGSGELLGLAGQATGKSGMNENRAGDDLGGKFKEVAGGKGTATQGIAGVGTKGRGSGNAGYGSGIGLGSGKGNVSIDAGGADEGWEGTIDREAVRRVIRSILNQIKSCYERQLRVNSTLEGKVVIQFEIMEQGRVRTARTKTSSLNDSTVESCVAARIKEARFPEPPTGTIAVVDYPFVFGSQR